MGRNHVKVYSDLRDADLRVIADIDGASAKKIGQMYGINWYVDYREMIARANLSKFRKCFMRAQDKKVFLNFTI